MITTNTRNAPDIGEMLRVHLKEHRIKQNGLSRYMGKFPLFIYISKKKKTLQTDALWDICHGLEYNFFEDIARALPDAFKSATTTNLKDTEIAALKAELEKVTIERDLLVKLAGK